MTTHTGLKHYTAAHLRDLIREIPGAERGGLRDGTEWQQPGTQYRGASPDRANPTAGQDA